MKRKEWILTAIIVVAASLLAACISFPVPGLGNSPSATPEGQPVVVINSPQDGASVPAGLEVLVFSTAVDVAGIARLELAVNGALVNTASSPQSGGQTQMLAQQAWVPPAPGNYTLSVTAYRSDGTASEPVTVVLEVTEPPPGAPVGGTDGTGAGTGLGVQPPPGMTPVVGVSVETPTGTPPSTLTLTASALTATSTTTSEFTETPTPATENGLAPTSTPTSTTGGPTATPTFTPTNTQPGPTFTPTYTPTTALAPTFTPTVQNEVPVAPEDARFNAPLNIPLDSTASVTDFVSYPGGDREDRVAWDITGMNPNPSLSGGQARLLISVSCFGTGTQNVQFFTGGQTYSCGQTIVDREVTADSRTGSVVITAVAGEGTYVQWVLTGTATRTN